MQGYTTMALEAIAQLQKERPTHIFLQAGVGAMAGALAGFFADYYQKAKPTIVIVEPNKADCIYRTAGADDGKIHIITGDMNTIMAGLACGEPCTVGWEMLSRYADYFVSMPDAIAAKECGFLEIHCQETRESFQVKVERLRLDLLQN